MIDFTGLPNRMFNGLVPRDKTLDNTIDELIEDVGIRDTLLTLEPKKLKKKKIVDLLTNCPNPANATIGFSRTIRKIEEYFQYLQET